MKYFLDTEFHEDGKTIDLISIAMVCEDGRQYYAVSSEFDRERAWAHPWLRVNVMPHVDPDIAKPRSQIRDEIVAFLAAPPVEWRPGEYREFEEEYLAGKHKPQFWGYYADYDWVALCQLFGRMVDLPDNFPRYCMDLKQLCNHVGNPQLPKQSETEHHALADARWNLDVYRFLMEKARKNKIDNGIAYMNFFAPDDM